jgi:hypothetical protein
LPTLHEQALTFQQVAGLAPKVETVVSVHLAETWFFASCGIVVAPLN